MLEGEWVAGRRGTGECGAVAADSRMNIVNENI